MAGNNPTAARRSSYAEKLKDPRWQKKRLEVLQRDGWACTSCCSETETLHVHHVMYWPKKEPWDYDECFLQTLCEGCHEEISGPDGYDIQGDAEALIKLIIKTGEGPTGINGWVEALECAWLATQSPGDRGILEVHTIVATAAIQRALRDDEFVRYMVERYRQDLPDGDPRRRVG